MCFEYKYDIYLNNQDGNISMNDELIKELLDSGNSFSDMWIKFGQKVYPYDENFMAVSNYVLNNALEESFAKK